VRGDVGQEDTGRLKGLFTLWLRVVSMMRPLLLVFDRRPFDPLRLSGILLELLVSEFYRLITCRLYLCNWSIRSKLNSGPPVYGRAQDIKDRLRLGKFQPCDKRDWFFYVHV